MRRHQFEAYLEKVFAFSHLVAQLSDRRRFPRHPCAKVFEALFLGTALQFPSVHALEQDCRDGALRKRIGPMSEETIRYVLQRLERPSLERLWEQVARRMKRNGLLRSAWARGLIVAAVDGIEVCSSTVRCCGTCLERRVQRKVGDEVHTVTEYYHRLVAVVVVSTPFPIPLGIRFQHKGEGEAHCTLALLRALSARLGKRFVDVIVGDALYLGTPQVAALDRLGLAWVISVKENQPELLEEVERLTRGLPTEQEVGPDGHWERWHLPDVYWARAHRSVRIVRTERTKRTMRQTIQRKGRRIIKEPVWEHSTTMYATNVPPFNLPPGVIEQVGGSRWRIDTEVFQVLTRACAFKRPSVHQRHDQALEVLTMIRVLAYTLALVFFHRQVLSHCRRHRPSFAHVARQMAMDVVRVDDSS